MFKNAEVATRFEMTGGDQQIYCPGYSGPLSNTPVSVIEGLISRNSNLVRPKQPTTGRKDEK